MRSRPTRRNYKPDVKKFRPPKMTIIDLANEFGGVTPDAWRIRLKKSKTSPKVIFKTSGKHYYNAKELREWCNTFLFIVK